MPPEPKTRLGPKVPQKTVAVKTEVTREEGSIEARKEAGREQLTGGLSVANEMLWLLLSALKKQSKRDEYGVDGKG